MNKTYCFKWKRGYIWRKKIVIGHSYEPDTDKMTLFFPEGGLREIAHWSDCEMALGVEWDHLHGGRSPDFNAKANEEGDLTDDRDTSKEL